MEKAVIIGPCVTDLVQFVKKLPQEGEEIVPLKTCERISGAGYCAAHLFSMLEMPAKLYTNPGRGIYGEKVIAKLEEEKIDWSARNEETAGCLYTLVDEDGNAVRMAVPGREYCFLPEEDPEEGRYILLDGSYLYDEENSLFPLFLSNPERTVLFAMHYAGIESDPSLLSALLESGPWLHLTEEEAAVYGDGETDLRKIAESLHDLTLQPVIILRTDGSGYFYNGEDAFETKSAVRTIKDRTGMAEAHAAAFLLAKNAGADHRSAMAFAGECASLAASSLTSLVEETYRDRVKNLLVQAILTESRGGRAQDYLS